MKIIFMGTPDFAVPCLEKLIESKNEVIAVFSQPDKPVGRKQVLTAPPVKQCAQKYNIPVYQPERVKTEDSAALIKSLGADLIVVVAYGKILSKEILEAPKYGCINVHASLLPQYRGAAPIQWAVIDGKQTTGVCVQKMEEGLDTGDVILVQKTDIDINETTPELFERLSLIGAELLLAAVEKIEDGSAELTKQNDALATYAPKITKELSVIDWNLSAFEIHNKVRGLQGSCPACTTLFGKQLKIHKTVLPGKKSDCMKGGTVVDNNKAIVVSCGDGSLLEILELQPLGKKRMDAKSFLLGNKIALNTVLGE